MANDDPQVVKFLNEDARVIAEDITRLRERMARVSNRWFGEIQNKVDDTPDVIEDGRGDRGVSRIAETELISSMNKMQQILDKMDEEGMLDELWKMRVRTLGD